jgi:hypothetical protein
MTASTDRTAQGTFAKGNTLRRTHGAKGFLNVGTMPLGCRAIRADLARFRAFVEESIRRESGSADGAIAASKAVLIGSAVTHEGARRLWMWWLARKADDLTPDQFARVLTEARLCLEARDRCLAALFGTATTFHPGLFGEDLASK